MNIDNKLLKPYKCVTCNFETNKKTNYENHLQTKKHKLNFGKEISKFKCECGKIYAFSQGLCRHKKTCIKIKSDEIIKVQEEKIKILEESNKQTIIINNDNSITNNNTINNQFNINLYLNENCKEALNLSDFIKAITVESSDLDFTLKHGLIEGINSVFTKHIGQYKNTDRPIQCSDIKRETLYIKDNNKWDKEDSKEKLRQVINTVTKKQTDSLNDYFDDKDPNWRDNVKKIEEWTSLVNTLTTEIDKNSQSENKIVKAIAKETIIDK